MDLNKFVLMLSLNHLQNTNNSLDTKKNLLVCQILKNSKARIKNFSLYDDLDFKSHFRLTRSSVEVSKLLIDYLLF